MKLTTSRQLLLSIPLLAGVLSASFAEARVDLNPGVNYNYAGIQVTDQNIDQYDCSQDGLSINGSFEVVESFFVLGSYTDVSGNNLCGSETISVGGGYHTLFNEDLSIYGALSFEDTSVDYGDSDSGLILAVGLRAFLTPKFEGKVEVSHHTAFDGNTVVGAGAAYWFHPRFGATADVGLGTEASHISIGLRVNF